MRLPGLILLVVVSLSTATLRTGEATVHGPRDTREHIDLTRTTEEQGGVIDNTSTVDVGGDVSQSNRDGIRSKEEDSSKADKTEIDLDNSEHVTKVLRNHGSSDSTISTESEYRSTVRNEKAIEEEVTVRSNFATNNEGISNESTNETNRISKKSSNLREVFDNQVNNNNITHSVRDTAGVGVSVCPPMCACSGGVRRTATCGGVAVTEEGGRYTVDCQNNAAMQLYMPDAEGLDNATDLYIPISSTPPISCSDLPSLLHWVNVSRTAGITLVVRGCDVIMSCLVQTLGRKVVSLMVQEAEEWRISQDELTGLQDLEELGIYYHDFPAIDLPWQALSSLPHLHSLTVSGASVSLPASLPAIPLSRLELSDCRLGRLQPGVFRELGRLERLYLQHNQLQDIDGGVFQGLGNLRELGLSSNNLSHIPRELAAHCPHLSVLSAFDNQITDIEGLNHLKELTELELFYNRAPLALPAYSLANMPALRVTDLRDSQLTALPDHFLDNTTALRTLLLQGNHIPNIPQGMLQSVQELELLDLSNNNLTKLHPDVFSGLRALTELRLDHNNVTELPDGMTSGLRSLRTLSVSNAALRRLHRTALSGCAELTTLVLSHNYLTTHWVQPEIMDELGLILNGLRQLEVIDLSHNKLTSVPSDVTSLLSLKRLDLSSNLIATISDLNFLSHTATIDLSHNLIQSLYLIEANQRDGNSNEDYSNVLLEDNPIVCDCLFYNALRRLRGYSHPYVDKITLEFGNTNCTAPETLKGRQVTSLQEQELYCEVNKEDYCNDNKTKCLPDDCTILFRQYSKSLDIHCRELPDILPDLKFVNGIALKLDTAPPSLSGLTAVTMLNLSGLGLTKVPEGMPPRSVKVIDLSHNNLTEVPVELLRNNVTLHVSGNPLHCSCDSMASLSTAQRHPQLLADYSTVRCTDGTALPAVGVSQLCVQRLAGAVGGALAAIGLLAGVLAVILLRYRVEAEILLAKAGLMRRRDETSDGRTFDAFVSYAHEDDAFVTQQLVPKLEGSEGLRLCIHSRDWIPGEWISSSISASVAHSRRTLIILSKHFLQSRWGRLEFQAATRGSEDRDQRARVIIVLLEDVSNHPELDDELKAYLRTNTYVKWGDPWFWKKLIHALPHHGKARIPVRSICDVIDHRKVMDEVVEGRHPADVIMAANGKLNAANGKLNAANGKLNSAYDGTDTDKIKDKLNKLNAIEANGSKNVKLNENLKLNPSFSMDDTRNKLNDKLKDNLSNKLSAIEGTLDALEQLEGKRKFNLNNQVL